MRIAIIGLGTVATCDALALARCHSVTMAGPVAARVEGINAGRYPVADPALEPYLRAAKPQLRATTDRSAALTGAEAVLIATPLALDPDSGQPDTAEVESAIAAVDRHAPGALIVIRSAVPIGFTQRLQSAYPRLALTVAPEFLREGTPLADTLKPRFTIVGDRGALGARVARLLADLAPGHDAPLRQTGPTEAEAIRHLSRALIEARVAYFNELDSYALARGLDSARIIEGVSLDPRVGKRTNTPCIGALSPMSARSSHTVSTAFAGIKAQVLPALKTARETRAQFLAGRNPCRVGSVETARLPVPESPLARIRQDPDARGIRVSTGPDEDTGWTVDTDMILAHRRPRNARLVCRDFPGHASA